MGFRDQFFETVLTQVGFWLHIAGFLLLIACLFAEFPLWVLGVPIGLMTNHLPRFARWQLSSLIWRAIR